MAVIKDKERCIGCGFCLLLCTVDAMEMLPAFSLTIDDNKCNECFECIDCCPNDALREGSR